MAGCLSVYWRLGAVVKWAKCRIREARVNTLSSELARRVAGVANRLRLVQADFADESAETRREMLAEEVRRALGEVGAEDRERFLEALREEFPAWEMVQPGGAAEEAPVAARSATDERELSDPAFLAERLAALAGSMTDEQKRAVEKHLKKAGVVSSPAPGGMPDEAAAVLRKTLGMTDGEALDAARMVKAAALMVEMAASLDQVVWNTWKTLSPRSDIRRGQPVKGTLKRYVAGDGEVAGTQVKQDLERLRQLTAALISSVSQAGRTFAQKHVEKFSPSEIEALAKMGGGGLLVSQEVKNWRKYVELAGPVDAISIEGELLAAIAGYAESLMKGIGR